MTEKTLTNKSKALQSVLACHKELEDECPEDLKNLIDEKLFEEILNAGLAFQFEDAPQKIKQNVRMQIRSKIRRFEQNDS